MHLYQPGLREALLRKTHIKSASIALAAFLIISGTWMVRLGLRDDGLIDLHSAVISGQFKTGSIGVFFAILGTLVVCALLFRRPHPQRFKVQANGVRIEWDGQVGDFNVLLAQLEAIGYVVQLPSDKISNTSLSEPYLAGKPANYDVR